MSSEEFGIGVIHSNSVVVDVRDVHYGLADDKRKQVEWR